MTRIKAILATIMLLVAIGGSMWTFSHYVASAASVITVSKRLTKHELNMAIAAVQQRLWKLEDRWDEKFFMAHNRYSKTTKELVAFMSEDGREMHRVLTADLERLKAELEAL